jgi:acyl-CoA hydrolase
VTAAAASDAEPAWDPHFVRTYNFFRGFQDAKTGSLIYNFGSLDGGVGVIWNAKQAFLISGGLKDTRVVPEIYNNAMAHQWATLAKITTHRYRRPVRFAGVMTQHHARFSLAPVDAHEALVRALADHVGDAAPAVPQNLTNITSN